MRSSVDNASGLGAHLTSSLSSVSVTEAKAEGVDSGWCMRLGPSEGRSGMGFGHKKLLKHEK